MCMSWLLLILIVSMHGSTMKCRIIFPEVLCLRNFSVKDLPNNRVLICDEFQFMFTSYPVGKPSANSRFLLTPYILNLGSEIDLHHYNKLSL